MDSQFIGFLAERNEDVVALLREVDRFKGELRTKVTQLGTLINLGERTNVRQSLFRESRTLFDDLVHDIHISDELPVRIDAVIGPQGWEIRIWLFRKGDQARLQSLGSDQIRLRGLLRSLSIPFEEGEAFTYPTRFAYTEPLDRLQSVIQELIDKIAETQ